MMFCIYCFVVCHFDINIETILHLPKKYIFKVIEYLKSIYFVVLNQKGVAALLRELGGEQDVTALAMIFKRVYHVVRISLDLSVSLISKINYIVC